MRVLGGGRQAGGAGAFDPAVEMSDLEVYIEPNDSTNDTANWTAVPNSGTAAFDFQGNSSFPAVGTINGEDVFRFQSTTPAALKNDPLNQWLTDDVYDIYMLAVLETASGTNQRWILAQDLMAGTGRFNLRFGQSGSLGKPTTFIVNGAGTHVGAHSTVVADGSTPVVLRFFSAGDGDHYIQVNDNAAELVITGQTFTPQNDGLYLGSNRAGTQRPVDSLFGPILGCTSVQDPTVAAACVAWLMERGGIA